MNTAQDALLEKYGRLRRAAQQVVDAPLCPHPSCATPAVMCADHREA